MSKLEHSNQFKRDIKKQPVELFMSIEWTEVVQCLLTDTPMKSKYHDHDLKHNWKGSRECHIRPDLLLIYERKSDHILLQRIGTHSELFG
ncbi:MAG: type II toxin-antitoxin system YafQ family toxin [Neisseriaceae bacterium]|nr:type II toxin-antitoxin system YafQ family toxin [Neisseriaceae bacterium]